MKWKSTFVVLTGLCILMFVGCIPVLAETQPVLPHAFYGTVLDSNGQPVAVGVAVEVRGTGVLTGVSGNPLTITEVGKFGGPGGLKPKLIVQGSVSDGTPLEFYVGNVRAQCYDVAAASGWKDTQIFKSGEVTQLNLQVGNGTATFTPTPTSTATASETAVVTSIPTTSGSYTGGGGGGGGGSSVGSSASSGSGTESTAVPTTKVPTTVATQDGQGAGTTATVTEAPMTQAEPGTPTQEMTAVVTPTAAGPTGQQVPISWIAGIIIVIIIIGAGAYYYYSRQKPPEKKE